MKKMFKKIAVVLTLLILFTTIIKIERTFAWQATEWTQILNNIELLNQKRNQATMIYNQAIYIKNQIEQLKSVATYGQLDWPKAITIVRQLDSIIKQGENISQSMGQIDKVFKKQYPDYETPSDYRKEYESWENTTRDIVKGSLRDAELNIRDFMTEETTMKTLQSMTENSQGQTQVLQASNMIAIEMVRQLQSLRALTASQINMQGTHLMSLENAKKAEEQDDSIFYAGAVEDNTPARKLLSVWDYKK